MLQKASDFAERNRQTRAGDVARLAANTRSQARWPSQWMWTSNQRSKSLLSKSTAKEARVTLCGVPAAAELFTKTAVCGPSSMACQSTSNRRTQQSGRCESTWPTNSKRSKTAPTRIPKRTLSVQWYSKWSRFVCFQNVPLKTNQIKQTESPRGMLRRKGERPCENA